MLARLRAHLTYANVVSTLCLFVLLGSGAYAAFQLPKDSVRSKHIVDGQVKSSDVRDDTLPGGGLDGQDIAGDALSGNDINEASLGPVPSAGNSDQLGFIGPGGFVQGSAKFYSNRITLPAGGGSSTVFDIDQLGQLYASCSNANEISMLYNNTTAENLYLILDVGDADPGTPTVLAPGNATAAIPKAGSERMLIQVGHDVGSSHDLATITATARGGNPCVVQAQAIAHTT